MMSFSLADFVNGSCSANYQHISFHNFFEAHSSYGLKITSLLAENQTFRQDMWK